MKKIKKNKKLRNDVILTASILIVAALVFFIIGLTRRDGSTVTVESEGEIIGEYPLNIDREIEITAKNGYNLLIIKDGKAFIRDASCPDKLCVNQGKISHNGETVVCLPNKTIVTVSSEERSDTDFVS